MVVIESHALQLLKSRNLGVFAHSVSQNIGDGDDVDLLSNSLNLEYQVNQLLQYEGSDATGNRDAVQGLIVKCLDLIKLAVVESIEAIILRVTLGQLYLLDDSYEQVVEVLEGFEIPQNTLDVRYVNSLRYEKWALLTIAYKKLNQLESSLKSLINGLNSSPVIPLISDVEATKWLNVLYSEFSETHPNHTVEQLQEVFKNKNFVLSYINSMKQSSPSIKAQTKEINAFIETRSTELLKNTSFPKADESNNYELEEFLTQVSTIIEYKDSRTLLEKGIFKTYQSLTLLNSYTSVLLRVGNSKEIKASFEVYLEYVESYYILNDHSYPDIVSILNLYKQILDSKFLKEEEPYFEDLSDEEYNYYSGVLDSFKKLVRFFYQDNGVIEIKDFEYDILKSFESDSITSNVSYSTKEILSHIWFTIAHSTFKIYQSSSSLLSENNDLILESLTFYMNSIHLKQSNLYHVFQYVKTLSILRYYKKAYKILKYLLKTISDNTSLIYFRSWHLLSLILSIEENKEESFKVVTFLSNEIDEFLQVQDVSIPFTYKQIFVEIKITQLAIIESLYGVEQALDSIPELFHLYNVLFKDSILDSKPSIPVKDPKTHRRSLSTTQTITKIKSISKSHKHHQQPTNIVESSRPKSIAIQKLLQKIWLVTSNIYSKLQLYSDAEQAIIEAENCYKSSSDTHCSLALLTMTTRPELSLQEFESALSLDGSSKIAIIGLSHLILTNDEIFIDAKDRLAAIARAKLLLESAVETFEGGYKSEIWWLLSKIYEKNGDKKRLNLSLWRSVELEESRPVREFEIV